MYSGKLLSVTRKIQVLLTLSIVIAIASAGQSVPTSSSGIQFIYTSDAHYGLTRHYFQGDSNIDAHLVNAAMIQKMNTLPGLHFPADSGVNAGKTIGAIDYLFQTGDIANRMEIPYQSAAQSWQQFETDYMSGLTLKNKQQQPTRLCLTPGNHDISNAIGFWRPMQPATDPTVLVKVYNSMMHPRTPKTNESYHYATDKIHYSFTAGGIHFLVINLWPDSSERTWMQQDLSSIPAIMPVIVFGHDPPAGEPKHFVNPITPHTINAHDKFENLTTELYKEPIATAEDSATTYIEQRGWVAFLKAHRNIKAYFHGHSNYTEYYVYHGPDNDVALNTFRVDSPMKGKFSSKEETKLSFQIVSINTQTQEMTVRECLWNTAPTHPAAAIVFGKSITVSLK